MASDFLGDISIHIMDFTSLYLRLGPWPLTRRIIIITEVSGVALLLLLLGLLVGPIIFFSAWNTFMSLGCSRFRPLQVPPLGVVFCLQVTSIYYVTMYLKNRALDFKPRGLRFI